jgi:hypothetical protein
MDVDSGEDLSHGDELDYDSDFDMGDDHGDEAIESDNRASEESFLHQYKILRPKDLIQDQLQAIDEIRQL